MKFKKFLVICGAVLLVYKTGEYFGHQRCLEKVAVKYKDDLFKNNDRITVNVTKKLAIAIFKPFEKGENEGA